MNESENMQSTPSFMGSDYLAGVIKSISAGNTDPSPAFDDPRPTAPPSDLLSSLLSSPELISKLPTIISTVKPLLEMLGTSARQSASAPQAAPVAATPEKGGGQLPVAARGGERGGNAHRSALLCALKPYLSSDRRQAIDYIIKLDRLGDVLKTL